MRLVINQHDEEKRGKARAAIVASGKKTGVIDCPACGGRNTLHFMVAYNGHVRAQCATAGCVEWME